MVEVPKIDKNSPINDLPRPISFAPKGASTDMPAARTTRNYSP